MKMNEYTLIPIHIGKIQVDLGIMTYRMNYGVKEWIPMISWYLKAGDKNILIDTGISSKGSAELTEAQIVDLTDLEEGLNRVGITANDIDLVIQTHLHYDHAGNTYRCRKARVIVQKSELEYALAPHPMQGYLYDSALLRDLRFELVEGDREILPGIEVVHLPSHTPGVQAVSIQTRAGRVVISGICCIGANFNPPEPPRDHQKRYYWKIVPPGNFINLYDAFNNMLRLKGLGDLLIPQHDVSLFSLTEVPSPQLKGKRILGC
jgi:N-acyl homoserine lactone hydrolase